jgi:hypothetical protein
VREEVQLLRLKLVEAPDPVQPLLLQPEIVLERVEAGRDASDLALELPDPALDRADVGLQP